MLPISYSLSKINWGLLWKAHSLAINRNWSVKALWECWSFYFCCRYHNHTMINYSPHTGKIVILEEDGWSSVLQVMIIIMQLQECCSKYLRDKGTLMIKVLHCLPWNSNLFVLTSGIKYQKLFLLGLVKYFSRIRWTFSIEWEVVSDQNLINV